MINYNTFEEFIKEYPKYKSISKNSVSKEVFNFFCDIENINKMILANNNDKPALAGCIYDLENKFGTNKEFDFQNVHVKHSIGAMVKFILEPFGYESLKPKRMPSKQTNFFSSAMVYKFNKEKAKVTIINNLTIEGVNYEK